MNMKATPIQRFALEDLSMLRKELQQSSLDSRQVAELLGAFLVERGYGVSTAAAHGAATRVDALCWTLPLLQSELEKLAWVT